MLSLEQIVNQTDFVRQALASRGEDAPLDRVIELDTERRAIIYEVEQLRASRNETSRKIGESGKRPSAELVAEMRRLGDAIRDGDARLSAVRDELHTILLALPNLPHPTVPPGLDERSNVVVRTRGEPDPHGYEPAPHWDTGPQAGIINMEAGARMSGARFYVLSGAGARLQRALVAWMLDTHCKNGYAEIAPPYLVRRETVVQSGNLPKFAGNLYRDDEDDLWLIPTSEVALNALHSGEIIPADSLPLKYVAHTPCFRREKTAAGRDTRGIKRVHQFEKVELFRYVEPEASDDALEEMLSEVASLCEELGFAYRIVSLCAGDMAFQAAKTYDVEVWATGSQEWLEVSSISTCTDFQARRSGTRYRPASGSSPRFPHTLNGSALALPRVLIALLENRRRADGSIDVPEVLRPYSRFDVIPGA